MQVYSDERVLTRSGIVYPYLRTCAVRADAAKRLFDDATHDALRAWLTDRGLSRRELSLDEVFGPKAIAPPSPLRAVFVIKGYVAGLYLPERAKNAAVILGMKGPKRLQIHPLRDVGADTFIRALNDGIHRNQTEIQVQKLADRLTQLEDTMRQIGSTKRGDTINFDYAPEAGTTISINGVARAKPIPGEDFYQAVLSIFIGNYPVDRDLKSGLLGT